MRISTGHNGFRVGSRWFDGSRRGSRPTAGVGLARSTVGVGPDPRPAWVQTHYWRGSRPTVCVSLAVVLWCFGCGSTGPDQHGSKPTTGVVPDPLLA
jgi:hypothetical protein